jgi:sec-independent protein translocase protein TatC
VADPEDIKSEEDELIDGGKVMSIWDHIGEMRVRLVRALIGIIAVFCVAMVFSDFLLVYLQKPLLLALPPELSKLHFTGPMDVFIVSIKVGFLVGIVGGSPIWLYQFWKFFEPALYPSERKYILPFVVASVLLFLTGVAFCFYIMLPIALEFLINYGMQVGTPIITIKDYMSMVMVLIFGFGMIFETPVILILLAMLDIISADQLAEHRRVILIAILVVAALLTPPDPISQLAMAVPVFVMYEASIIIIRLIKKKPNENLPAT